jgi:hypothetical protein
MTLAARGTSENGKFGYRVGDPVIGNITEVLPGSRGYPIQVRFRLGVL